VLDELEHMFSFYDQITVDISDRASQMIGWPGCEWHHLMHLSQPGHSAVAPPGGR